MSNMWYSHLNLLTVAFFITGSLLHYWINKRRFNRRNVAGFQQFSHYQNAVLITIFEKVVKLLANLLIVSAIGLHMIS